MHVNDWKMPKDVKQAILSCSRRITTSPKHHAVIQDNVYISPRSSDKKLKLVCDEGNRFVCKVITERLCNQFEQQHFCLQRLTLQAEKTRTLSLLQYYWDFYNTLE